MLRTLVLPLLLTLGGVAAVGEAPTAVTGVQFPGEYRTWAVVAPSHRTDKGHLRMMLANPVMADAYRSGTLPFPEGSKIAKLIYQAQESAEWSGAVVPGAAVSVEIMEKDSKRFPEAAGGDSGGSRLTVRR